MNYFEFGRSLIPTFLSHQRHPKNHWSKFSFSNWFVQIPSREMLPNFGLQLHILIIYMQHHNIELTANLELQIFLWVLEQSQTMWFFGRKRFLQRLCRLISPENLKKISKSSKFKKCFQKKHPAQLNLHIIYLKAALFVAKVVFIPKQSKLSYTEVHQPQQIHFIFSQNKQKFLVVAEKWTGYHYRHGRDVFWRSR